MASSTSLRVAPAAEPTDLSRSIGQDSAANRRLPVMGTFEIDAQGKISAWRDYFDLAQFTKQMS